MNIILPSRSVFWRFIFLLTAVMPFLAIYQLFGRAKVLGVNISASIFWMALLGGLGLFGLFSLLLFASTLRPFAGSRYRERIFSLLESPERAPDSVRWIGALLIVLAVIGFTGVFMISVIQSRFGSVGWMRYLIFWLFSLMGMWGIKLLRPQVPWFFALIGVILAQSALHLLLIYWPRVTEYPFAMGWSETSRFYHPTGFVSELVYGKRYPWPIQNPSLHLLLSAPYLFDAPLWVHRFWQVALRYLFVGAVVPALLKRLSIQGNGARWLIGLWMFLFLFMGPVYFHLTIAVILVLLGFSHQNDRRTWVVILLASFWCGWSRVNWYPMPGIIAAILYFMEVPLKGKNIWQYLLKPALWVTIGTLGAFLSQRTYIALSGIPDPRLFYTSFISDLLWYRLWPNSSFSFGILPALLLVSVPAWLVIYIILRSHKADWHPIRLVSIFAALFIICLGGIIVSLKIGGGANLHNMDAYFVLLLIVTTYLIFARYRSETGNVVQAAPLHWLLVLALMYSPVSTFLQFGVGFPSYDRASTQEVLARLQAHVDAVNEQNGEILFITQRHLISMDMLQNVTLVWEYEREDLMEMAMSNNQRYLEQFRKDMDTQRFALIVVDPLNYNLLTRRKSFSEENNAWVRRAMKPILCNYRVEETFTADDLTLYVPQEGVRQCP
jgi:hypothetical protein